MTDNFKETFAKNVNYGNDMNICKENNREAPVKTIILFTFSDYNDDGDSKKREMLLEALGESNIIEHKDQSSILCKLHISSVKQRLIKRFEMVDLGEDEFISIFYADDTKVGNLKEHKITRNTEFMR